MTEQICHGPLATVTYSYWANARRAEISHRESGCVDLEAVNMLQKIASARPSDQLAGAAGNALLVLRRAQGSRRQSA